MASVACSSCVGNVVHNAVASWQIREIKSVVAKVGARSLVSVATPRAEVDLNDERAPQCVRGSASKRCDGRSGPGDHTDTCAYPELQRRSARGGSGQISCGVTINAHCAIPFHPRRGSTSSAAARGIACARGPRCNFRRHGPLRSEAIVCRLTSVLASAGRKSDGPINPGRLKLGRNSHCGCRLRHATCLSLQSPRRDDRAFCVSST